jgi:hypothetical protein
MHNYTKPLIMIFIIFLLATGMGFSITHSYQPDNTLHKSVLCEPVPTVNMCENLAMHIQESDIDINQRSYVGVDKRKKTTVKHKHKRRKTIRKKTAPNLSAGKNL